MEHTTSQPPPALDTSPIRRRWPVVIGSLIGLAGLALGLHLAGVFEPAVGSTPEDKDPQLTDEERARHKKKLADAIAELDRTDPGWRLEEIEAKRAKVPDEENAALIVQAAAKELPDKWDWIEFAVDAERFAPNRRLTEQKKKQFVAEAERLSNALKQARRLADRSTGRFLRVPRKDTLATSVDSAAIMNRSSVLVLLGIEATLQIENRELDKALGSCQAMINAGRSVGDDPVGIAQVSRYLAATRACAMIDRVLAQGEPAEEALRTMQQILEKEDLTFDYGAIIRGEWAFMYRLLEEAEKNPDTSARLRREPFSDKETTGEYSLSDELLITRADMFAFRKRELKIAAMPLHERPQAMAELKADMTEHFMWRAFRLSPGGAMLDQGDRIYRMRLRTTIVALAAERYRRKHNAWPARIEDLKPLVPEAFLIDPASGNPLRMRRTKEGLVIYSLGPDGKDSGGMLVTRLEEGKPGDIGVRLWDVKHRGLPPMAEKPESQQP